MRNFSYANPVKIIFGKNTIPQIAAEIPADKKILLVYGCFNDTAKTSQPMWWNEF